MKPPGRPEPQARIVAGQRSKLPRVSALIEREQNDREVAGVAHRIKHRLEGVDIFGPRRNVAPLVTTVTGEQRTIMVAKRAGVNLHDHAILNRHARHLGQHLRAEQFRIRRRPEPADDAREQGLRFGCRQIGSPRCWMTVVGRRGSCAAKVGATPAVSGQIATPAVHILSGQFAKPCQHARELFVLDVDHPVRAVGGDHATGPAGTTDATVRLQIIVGAFGRRQKVDIEAVEQSTWPKCRRGELFGNRIIIEVGRGAFQNDVQPENRCENMIEPKARGRAAKQVIVRGEGAPGFTSVSCRLAIAPRDGERVKPHTLAVEHPENVMVRLQQQLGRLAPGAIVGEPSRISMPVRADNRQPGDLGVERARDRPLRGIARKQAVGVKNKWSAHVCADEPCRM